MINENELRSKIEDYFTIRDLAKYYECSISTVQYWLRVFNLKTVFSDKRKLKPKIDMPIATSNFKKGFHIDISDLTIFPYNKHERSTIFSIFTINIDKVKYAYLYQTTAIHNKVLISNILLNLKSKHNCDVVFSDKEFYYLKDVGFKVYKKATWNCSKLVNEKQFGNLKRWVYCILRKLKRDFKFSNKDLMDNPLMVKNIYITLLKKYGFQVIDNSNIVENQVKSMIVHA
jgi:hypothetical protein